jgi:signal transduction histidine kinase
VAVVSEPSAPAVLVVDYDVARLARVRTMLAREGHAVAVGNDSASALAAADASIGVAVVADEMQPGALERLIGTLRGRTSSLQVILVASARSGRLARETLGRLGALAYVRDTTRPERLLTAVDAAVRVARQLAAAHASERLKMELLASASHEFRTPLNVILGYLELVRDGAYGDSGDAMRGVLGTLERNASYLLELVEGFLDLAKLESSTLTLEAVDLASLVRALASDHALLLGERPIALRVDVAADLPPVRAEAAKVRVVVQNLLANALKFTERGEVAVLAAPAGDGRVEVRVRDTGPGIPPEARDAIFELFRQLQPNDPRRKGVGLGLALARRFARAMGGDLTVESAPGGGSTFTLTLPAAEPERRALSFARDA